MLFVNTQFELTVCPLFRGRKKSSNNFIESWNEKGRDD